MRVKKWMYASFSPPGGTCARARDRRMKNPDGTAAAIDPKPFRSGDFPDDLSMLQDSEKVRVGTESELHRSTVRWL